MLPHPRPRDLERAARRLVTGARGRTGRRDALEPVITVIGDRIRLDSIPGSAAVLDADVIQEARVFTVNEALRKVPGIFARDEEGFGLRPNLGIRGLNPTRSTKVLLLEDGIPLSYAPYGDNATYYHPPVERFERIEVLKGSGQILFGPHTVGGVINYITPAVPDEATGRRAGVVRHRRLSRTARPVRRPVRRHRVRGARHVQAERRCAREHEFRGRRPQPQGRARHQRPAGAHAARQLVRRIVAGDLFGAHARRMARRPVPESVQERPHVRTALGRVGDAPVRSRATP